MQWSFLISIIALVLLNAPRMAIADPNVLGVLVPEDDLLQYHMMLGKRDVMTVSDYGGPYSNREAVELVLFHQALRLGGFDGEVKLIAENNYSRIIRLIEQGKAALTATPIWSQDVQNTNAYWISDPLVRQGEYAVGVYTRPDNTHVMQATHLEDYAALSAVSNRNWKVDWQTLEAMHVARLYHINTMELMVKMIGARRGDFMLAPFSSREDLAIMESGVHLVPVPGVKVILNDSRHWIVSKEHPQGEQAYQALQAGLRQLREQRRVHQAYEQSGFFNPSVVDWQPINLPKPAATTEAFGINPAAVSAE